MRYARIDWTDPENPRVRTYRDYEIAPVGIKLENGYPVLVPSTVAEAPEYDRELEIRERTETITAQGHSITWTVRPMTAAELETRAEQERQSIESEIPDFVLRRQLRSSVDIDTVDSTDLPHYVSLYPQYRVGVAYEAGGLLGYGRTTIIRVIQGHTSQRDWNPLVEDSLYQVLAPDEGGEYPTWQDWGGNNENLYSTGDRVTHSGQNWESKVDGNHWEPTLDNWAAWDLLEDA